MGSLLDIARLLKFVNITEREYLALIPVTKVNFGYLDRQILSIIGLMITLPNFCQTKKLAQFSLTTLFIVLIASINTCNLAAGAQDSLDSKSVALKGQVSGRQKKVVLALGGGGTRGAAHIGVLKVLAENNIKIDGIVGTSIGAIVGGLYCSGVKADQLENILLEKSFLHSYLTVPIALRIMVVPIFVLPHLVGYHPYDGLYSGKRFSKYINAHIPLANKDIEKLPVKFGAVCCDLLTAEPYMIRSGNIGRAIQASSAIPMLRRPVAFDKNCPDNFNIKDGSDSMALLVDGGLQANLPVEQARAMAKELGDDTVVIAINVNPVFERANGKVFRHIGSVSKRTLNIFLTEVDKNEIARADLTLQPATKDISILSTNFNDARKAISAGEITATAAMPQIKALLRTTSE